MNPYSSFQTQPSLQVPPQQVPPQMSSQQVEAQAAMSPQQQIQLQQQWQLQRQIIERARQNSNATVMMPQRQSSQESARQPLSNSFGSTKPLRRDSFMQGTHAQPVDIPRRRRNSIEKMIQPEDRSAGIGGFINVHKASGIGNNVRDDRDSGIGKLCFEEKIGSSTESGSFSSLRRLSSFKRVVSFSSLRHRGSSGSNVEEAPRRSSQEMQVDADNSEDVPHVSDSMSSEPMDVDPGDCNCPESQHSHTPHSRHFWKKLF
ncbi:hypothetical protein GGI25_001635 [Coemansia spiralis]|uniref:Uncharacterized protein n=2 Tax=Coemansia TaxID=4863 RepID=A0A9W8KZV8_9FUNG|nr:hypothetical protein BX070DRAFT_61588 [Coemansia spiralis]KAJ1991572.1 hypothetical protein EDC05_003337 [Coemansia umbellata]KAJ2623933.1 hypothetical protein GGI26_001948 [Coemansia sp. RSA 1358]KAJ2679279.1 hypothetical protein GGI25_001635 [Coemansia spiralis]